ncbi:MAG: ankyrin repeat domain-containing protein [Desulfobacteraceae bacterium]|nr:ankyrin repeat domain-containing protein [Desulfobacteraceae bacterium]
MAFDPAQLSYNRNSYQNGLNDTDNRTNQNNQPAGRLKFLKKGPQQPPKARACNNADGSKPSALPFKKLRRFVKFIKLTKKIERQEKRKAYSQDYKNKHLFDAIKKGNDKWVNKWLDAGADVNQANRWHQTPLSKAAKNGHIEIVESLLSHRNSRDKIDVNLRHPLYEAARYGHIEIVRLLLSHPNSSNKIDVNLWNPLSKAAENGHIEIVKLLLSHPNSRDKIEVNLWNPLSKAAENNHVDVVNALLSHPKINMDEDARRYLDRLVDNNDVYSIQEIVLNGCSKKVYQHLYTKAFEAGRRQLIERLCHFLPGYANTEALGGHNKAYFGSGDVPEDILRSIKEYLNLNLPKQTNVSDTQERTCIRKSLQTRIQELKNKLLS